MTTGTSTQNSENRARSLEIRNALKIFENTVHAVNDVSLTVDPGEFLVLVGPSGCGKSTMLRLLAGLEKLDGGDILLDDKSIANVPPRDRDIAMVFQNYALYPTMKVFDNLAFPLKMRRWKKADIREQVFKVADQLEIRHLLKRRPAQLSGGQRQRVALGRAMVREPALFLMDEPLSNLDAELRVQTRHEIVDLQRRLGITTVYVTHDQTEAMTMGTRIAVMRDGVLQQYDTPTTLYDRPQNVFVARFIGSPPMNVWEGHCTGASLSLGNQSVDMPPWLANALCDSEVRQYKFGLRPENMRLTIDPSQDAWATVHTVEDVGRECFVYMELEGLEELFILSAPHVNVKQGERVGISLDWQNLHLFDAETEQRIVLET